MKRRGTTTQRAVVKGDDEKSKGNDNAFCWRGPCSTATGTGPGGADWQTTQTHPSSWRQVSGISEKQWIETGQQRYSATPETTRTDS
jgi:hypothetical protein